MSNLEDIYIYIYSPLMHLKYVDDLTLLEAINLPKQLESVPDDVM